MAILGVSAELIGEYVVKYNIKGSCLQLARQDVRLTPKDFSRLLDNLDKQFPNSKELTAHARSQLGSSLESGNTFSERPKIKEAGYISDQLFFNALGFDKLSSVDASDFEGADIIHDLNQDGLREKTNGTFNFALETGTAEHIFHFPNYLKNVCDCIEIGGYILHFVPTNNFVDHGFYQFSPTLFYDFYRINRFKILDMQIFETKSEEWNRYNQSKYVPGIFDTCDRKRFAGRYVMLAILVRKTEDSSSNRIPQQRIYAENADWKEKSEVDVIAISEPIGTLTGPYKHEAGYSWIAKLPRIAGMGDMPEASRNSRLILLEDGKYYGRGHSVHADIRNIGEGRYSHWKKVLYFSSSDNTDPNTNNRQYEIRLMTNDIF